MLNKFLTKEHLISAAQTFATAFILTAGAYVSSGHSVEFTASFATALALTAARAGVKAVWQSFMPETLGGVSKVKAIE